MDFYKVGFILGYLDEEQLREATKWGCLSKEDFKAITEKDYEISPGDKSIIDITSKVI